MAGRLKSNTFKCVILLAGAAMPAATWAQGSTPPQPAAEPGPTAGAGAVDPSEIIVTAQRRAERLEQVPMAVTFISPDVLAKSGVNNLQDIGRIAPGVQVNQSGLSTQPAIRGVTTLTNGAFNENNIGIYVDGFYVPDTLSINSDLVSIKDIQVLKGPQGTLYGRNATGGAILINTLDPTSTMTGSFGAEYGRFDEYALKGYVAGPITDKILFSVAAASRHGDGYIRLSDPTNANKKAGNAAPFTNQSVRLKLLAHLTDTLTATLGFNYGLASDPRGVLFTPRAYIPAFVPAPPVRASDPTTASYNNDQTVRAKTYEGTFKLALDTGIGALTSRTSYARREAEVNFDFDGTYSPITYAHNLYKAHTFQESLDYSVDAIKNVDLLVGAFYYDDFSGPGAKYESVNFGTVAGAFVPTAASTVILKSRSYAFYVDATYHLTDKLTINAGGRYSHDNRKVNEFQLSLPSGAFTLPPVANSANFHKFTPRVSVRYELAPRTNVYATYSVGYRSGSYNANPVSNAVFLKPIRPEQLKSYEIGIKTAQRGLRAELAGFYYDYKDYNVSLTVTNPFTGGPTTLIGNAPKATIYGIDGQVTWSITPTTNVTDGGAWLHARYGTFTNAIGTGINAAGTLNVGSQTQNWTGQQMSRAPNFSASVAADQTIDLAGGKLVASANLKYSDSYVISNPSLFGPLAGALANKQRYRQGTTTLLDAQLNWTDPSKHFLVGIWGKNLTNQKYRLTYNGTSSFGDYSVRAAPVTFGGRVGYNF